MRLVQWTKCTIAVLLAAFACLPATGALPDGTVGAGLGIVIRRPADVDLQAVRAAGFRIVRTNFNWQSSETTPGTYDFKAMRRQADAMRRAGLRPMFILDYGNPLYSPPVRTNRYNVVTMRPAAPNDERSVAAFAAFAVAGARAFAGYAPIWEIWNEPDVKHFWPPVGDPAAYGRLADRTCGALRAAQPGVTVIGPAVSQPPFTGIRDTSFVQQLSGKWMRCIDGFSAHPYSNTGDAANDLPNWQRLRGLVDAQVRSGRRPALVNSELGHASWQSVSEADQARYAVRAIVLNHAAGVTTNVWYEWQDAAEDTGEIAHYGLLRADGTAKPALAAIRTMAAEIGAMRFRCLAPARDLATTAAVFSDPVGNAVAVVWSDRPGWWRPPAAASVSGVRGLSGKGLHVPGAVPIYSDPVYVHLHHVSALCAAAR